VNEQFYQNSSGIWQYYEWPNDHVPLHFHHANAYPAGVYKPFLDQLAQNHHLFALNASGFGRSRSAADHQQWETLAEDLTSFLSDITPAPVIGVGHSLGGVLTLMAAVWQPHLFRHIVLVDPVIFTPVVLFSLGIYHRIRGLENLAIARKAKHRRTQFNSRNALLERYRQRPVYSRWQPEYLEAFADYGFRKTPDRSLQLDFDPQTEIDIYVGIPRNIWYYIRRCKVPMTIVRGVYSDTLSARALRLIGRIQPDAQLIELDQCGHLLIFERPDAVLELLSSI